MHRAYFIAGWGWVAIATTLVLRAQSPVYVPVEPVVMPAVFSGTDAAEWFSRIKPYCNDLEVEIGLRSTPPPAGWEGAGYAAACRAIAGRIDGARAGLLALPENERNAAVSIVFDVGHPIADMGDDRSAGPIMRLVVEFQPWNYMALYHAGMSYYVLGEPRLARRHLIDFLKLYDIDDGWASNAREVLRRLERGEGP